MFERRKIIIENNFIKIPLTQGKFTLIDKDDFNKINQYIWHFDGRYAATNHKRKHLRLHRILLNVPPKFHTDHINGNPLDNRKFNLRICSQTENIRNKGFSKNNTSGYKGIFFNKSVGFFQSYITVNRKHKYLGRFISAIEAAIAYDKAAKQYFGEFARTNF